MEPCFVNPVIDDARALRLSTALYQCLLDPEAGADQGAAVVVSEVAKFLCEIFERLPSFAAIRNSRSNHRIWPDIRNERKDGLPP